MIIAAGSTEAALAFLEIGAVALGLAVLARMAGRLGITAVPLYLIAGLALGEGGVVQLDVSESFISLTAEIGVLLLLFALGLEYSESELREGLRTGLPPGFADMLRRNRVNPSKSNAFPAWQDWPQDYRLLVDDYCGELAARYGYELGDA